MPSRIAMSLSIGPIRGVMSNAVLRWFGRNSYGIYIFHPIAVGLTITIASTPLARNSEATRDEDAGLGCRYRG
ncbi:MAG: hypothetical protein JOZ83_13945 [Silvibacterium sp.]|nr:hypothetical protein [Silvibacterium sp.]